MSAVRPTGGQASLDHGFHDHLGPSPGQIMAKPDRTGLSGTLELLHPGRSIVA